MSPDKQRVAIAEACGWHIREGGTFKYLCRPGEDKGAACGLHQANREIYPLFFELDECGPDYVIPDYCNDLNACHEMEKVLTDEQKAEYSMTLHEMHGIPLATFWHRVICSTAAQRAEAFLRTIGKWEEGT